MQSHEAGFTLIELSIVLVIIGLIVGGVLTGQDLIRAAEVRATISQVEKFNTAANTFYGKYGYLPGDINANAAAQFGFAARGTGPGQGDGNGILQGQQCPLAGFVQDQGETVMFWVDLSSAVAGNLIEGGFNTAHPDVRATGSDITGININFYLPQAKLGRGNYFYAYSSDYCSGSCTTTGTNYFGLSAATNIAASSNCGAMYSTPNLPVAVAYAIDKKMDDGLPQSGNVMAWYLNIYQWWTDGTEATWVPNEPQPYSGALVGSSTTCYDNGNVSGATTQYSLGQNSGAGANCALSFRFQ